MFERDGPTRFTGDSGEGEVGDFRGGNDEAVVEGAGEKIRPTQCIPGLLSGLIQKSVDARAIPEHSTGTIAIRSGIEGDGV